MIQVAKRRCDYCGKYRTCSCGDFRWICDDCNMEWMMVDALAEKLNKKGEDNKKEEEEK